MEYKIFSPSYKRSNLCKTHRYLNNVIYVIRESEAEEYKDVHDKLWIVPDSAQGNLCRIRNYILNNAKEENIILIDDDIKYFGRWNGNKSHKLNEGEVYKMIENGIGLATDLNVHFWGLNCLMDKGAYREYTPFGSCQYIGGPFQAHRNNDLRYDEKIYLKEDYDMTIQILNKYRKNLRLNMYHYVCDQNTLAGGCAEYRNIAREMEHNKMLQKKWGKDIITRDKNSKRSFDFNPIMKVPIRGV